MSLRRYLFYLRPQQRTPHLRGRLREKTDFELLPIEEELALLTGIPRDRHAISDVLAEYNVHDVFELIEKIKPHRPNWRERLRILWCLWCGDYTYEPRSGK